MHIASNVSLRTRERAGAPVFADIPLQQVASRLADMPEKRLMLAVLLDAIVQLRRSGSTGAIEASRWIHGEGADDSAFSFRAVCDALGLDPGYLSRGVFSWAREPSQVVSMHATPLRRPQARALRMTARRRRVRSAAAV
jgi:hypothetical protein